VPDHKSLTVEGGPYDYYRVLGKFAAVVGDHQFGASVQGSSENGYRDDTGADQQKASFVHITDVGDWQVMNTLNWTNLNQETGGFVFGYKAYKDSQLRKSNPNPEAYRDAWSLRLASHWVSDNWSIVPYFRSSDMEFLQHFLPGQPRERNDQTSGGIIIERDLEFADGVELTLGSQAELMAGHLDEFQEEELTDSSAFNNAVRNQGTHYDYDVDSVMIAGYYNLNWQLGERTRLVHSLRIEYLEYDYDNKGLDGNTRDDGTECGFGGCLYNRPADQNDDFDNIAGRLGIEHDLALGTAYAVVGSGFRPPQATELYRLQRNQETTDLDSEELLSFEAGMKADWWTMAVFAQAADNIIFRDAAGLNVSDGETESLGVEFSAWRSFGAHTFSVAGTYARHRYAFDRNVSGGEVIEDGNMVDTAPRWLGNAMWRLQATPRIETELEMVYQGKHYINAANTAKYNGHTIFNLRGRWAVRDGVTLFGRVINLLDEDYADRADWTVFNPANYRYFPAMPRQLYLGVTVAL
jgi:outer membrane receptor protein involved in Fe transport